MANESPTSSMAMTPLDSSQDDKRIGPSGGKVRKL